MSPAKPINPGKPDVPCQPQEEDWEGKEFGFPKDFDWEPYRYSLIAPPKHLVGTTVPESVYLKLLLYPGGISRFFEDAVAAFDGDLQALLEAVTHFLSDRKREMEENPVRNANGRVLKETFQKIEHYKKALAGIRGMSRAKVLAGLIHLKLTSHFNP